MNILDRHRRFIDEDPDGKSQSAKSHQVDRLSSKPQCDDRATDRKRDIQNHHQSASPIPKKQQDHHPHEYRPEKALAHHAPNSPGHKRGLIKLEPHIDPFPIRTQSFLHFRDRGFDLLDDAQRRSLRTFIRKNVHRSATIDQSITRRCVGRIADRSYVTDVDRMLSGTDRDRRKLLRILNHRVDRDDRISITHRQIARRTQCVALGQRRDDLLGRHAVRLQFLWIDRNDDRSGGTTKGWRGRNAREIREHRSNSKQRQILDFRDASRITR